MPRPCTVCSHPKREEIDKALLENVAGLRVVAKRFEVSLTAMWRHQTKHLPVTLARGFAAVGAAPPRPVKPPKPAAPALSSEDAQAKRIAEHAVAVEAKQERHAIDTVQQLRAINVACLEVLREARASGKSMMLLQAVDRIARQIELQAKLLGQIQDGATVNVAVLPEWHGIRQVVLQALGPYPQARLAVAEALKGASA